jgi:nonsense-mediated mRNA decay protein 3
LVPCPTCGREVAELIDGACADCTSQRLVALKLPEVIDAVECAHCHRLSSGSSWRTTTHDPDQRLEEIVRELIELDGRLTHVALGVQPHWEDKKNATATVTLDAQLQGVPLHRESTARLRYKTGACVDCSREMGGYFEAIIQIRGATGSDLSIHLPDIEHWLFTRIQALKAEDRPNAFVTKVERSKHGHDYYMGNHELARQLSTELAERYGAETDESTSLVTRKDGRDVFRWTHLVRLPPYAKGDFLLVQGVPTKLLGFDRRTLHLLDLDRRVKVRRELYRVQPVKVIGRLRDQLDAIVVSRGSAHVQVMDPVSFKTLDIEAAIVPAGRETVPVFRHEETLYVVLESKEQG